MIKGLLSVIIPTYKRSVKVLRRSVESVINQDYPHMEIIVVDDNENDSLYSKDIEKYCNSLESVRYIKQDGNKGACAARNLGIVESNGEYIGFLDDDDKWESTKAKKQIARFKDNVGMVYCKGLLIDENHVIPKESVYYNAHFFKEKVTFEDMIMMDYIGTTSQAIIHKRCFIKCGGFDEELLARQDYEMWIRISKYFDIVGVNEYLFKHYIHKGEQISKNTYKSLQGYKRIYEVYRDDFKKNKLARRNITKRIAYLAKLNKEYGCAYRYAFKYFLSSPISLLKIKKINKFLKKI